MAKRLQSRPCIDAFFARRAISYSMVRIMVRSATPEDEEVLLNAARHGMVQHVEKLVRQHQRVQRLNTQEQANGAGGDKENRMPTTSSQGAALQDRDNGDPNRGNVASG